MKKLILKLKRGHPANKMRLGSHVITNAETSYELNDQEIKELESPGGKHWFQIIKSETKPAKKPVSKEE